MRNPFTFPMFYATQEHSSVTVANSVYVQTGFELNPNFTWISRAGLHVWVQQVDFRNRIEASQRINFWVEQKTSGKFVNFFAPGSVSLILRF